MRSSPCLRHAVLIGALLASLIGAPPARPALAADFTVTTTADSGPGSLRQALLDANNTPGLDTIGFAIGTVSSQHTLQPLSALPIITDTVVIDGWSQGGASYAGPPLIEINGSAIATWNTVEGLEIAAGGSTVRGLALNYFDIGLVLRTAGGNVIAGNYLGLALDGVTAIGNRTGLSIQASSDGNRIGTDGDGVNDAAERNIISASGLVQVNNSVGLLIAPGSDNNWVAGNYIGTDASGTLDRGNQSIGVSTGGVTIIGTNGDGVGDAGEGNLVSGNGGHGIQLGTTASGSQVAGNRIGTDVTGLLALPNADHGISVSPCFGGGQCSNHVIGTNGDGVSDALEGNLISGNQSAGIFIPAGTLGNNVIAGNRIGTNALGDAALPNGDYGLHLGGTANRVGTNGDGVADDLEGNLISGNGDSLGNDNHGIYSPGAATTQNVIAGNRIGTNASGTAPVPNGQAGILLEGSHSTVRDNLISGNGTHGLHLSNAFTHTITGNQIGTAADGVLPLGNGLHGVYISTNSDGHAVGGTGASDGNVIAHNGSDGVFVDNNCGGGFCIGNAVVGNALFANAGLGIDLFPDGVNANDALDPDTGANGRQNFPVISAVEAASSVLTATGTLSSTANAAFALRFYSSAACDPSDHGEGEAYLGAISATTDALGLAVFTATLTAAVPDGSRITATATDSAGNTSEFSACSAPTGYAPISGLQATNDSPTFLGAATRLTATVAAGTGVSYAWHLGDGQLAAGTSISHVFGAIGVYTAVVTATNSGSAASAATVVTVLPPPACAATADDGVTTFTSEDALAAQQAVDAAPVGGRVKLAGQCTGAALRNGVTQTIYLDKPLTLRGGYSFRDWSQSLPLTQPTVLDAIGLGRVVFITNTVPVTIEHLSLQNGIAGGVSATCPTTGCGGGIYTNGSLALHGVTVRDHAAARAGGAYVLGTLQASDTTWQGNQCSQTRGGALEVYGPATLTGGLFSGNQCSYAGAVFAGAALTVSGTHFISNTASHPTVGSGGAIYANGTLTMVNARFERNTAQTGAGAVLHTGAASDQLSIIATSFISNTAVQASAQGGALYASVPVANIADSLFEGNSTPGAIGNGGALVALNAITLTHVTLNANFAGSQGGALYHWGLSEIGNTSQIRPLVLSNTVLTGNHAGGEGGALYFRRGFAAANVPVRLEQVTFLSNSAVLSGGAAFLGQPATVVNSLFRTNASGSTGGGLYLQDSLQLDSARFLDNSATVGGGLAIAAQSGTSSLLVNTVLAGNQATANGAGLAFTGAGHVDILHTTIAGTALSPGQAVFANGGTIRITNTIVASHTVGLALRAGVMTAQHSLFFGNLSNVVGSVTNTSPVAGDPHFLDPAAGDYHLVLGSAALDAGLQAGLGHDFEGDVRFIGVGLDIGADEFGSAALVAPGSTTTLSVNPRAGQLISLTLPPGALGGTGVIRLAPTETPTRPLPPGHAPANISFLLSRVPVSAQSTAFAATTDSPFSIEIHYRDSDVLGWGEAGLELLWWDEAGQTWRPAQTSCALNVAPVQRPGENTITTVACALGEFALTIRPFQLYLPIVPGP